MSNEQNEKDYFLRQVKIEQMPNETGGKDHLRQVCFDRGGCGSLRPKKHDKLRK
ncbi:MAG: hypothetical protein IPK03_05700 [Bacteroidetes bacterium]|nr:hypothetical protein [Bacteroidota bacterium]